MWVSLSLFFAYHMYLVKLGFTTNEKVKKSCLEEDIDIGIHRYMKAIAELKDINSEDKKARYIEIKECIGELRERERKLKALSYAPSFWSNLKSIVTA